MVPFLSIITPVFNRERYVARCIESVLRQDWGDYELVVVDDCSSDRSVEIVRGFADKRIRVLQHDQNQGVGPARNTGLAKARGEWVLTLDSDDELVDGCLRIVHQHLSALSSDVMSARFLCKLDDGTISPDPLPRAGVLDYFGYIRFQEDHLESSNDFVDCVRRISHSEISYPTNRGLEDLYHLRFHKRFHSHVFHDVVRLYHQDAENQITKQVGAFNLKTDLSFARDRADNLEQIVVEHGEALRQHGPRLYNQYVLRLAVLQFLGGRRGKGLRFGAEAVRSQPLSMRAWGVLLFGVWGHRPILWARAAAKSFAGR